MSRCPSAVATRSTPRAAPRRITTSLTPASTYRAPPTNGRSPSSTTHKHAVARTRARGDFSSASKTVV